VELADTLDFSREIRFAKLSLHREIYGVDVPKSVKPSQTTEWQYRASRRGKILRASVETIRNEPNVSNDDG
jgi:hypothetical protein